MDKTHKEQDYAARMRRNKPVKRGAKVVRNDDKRMREARRRIEDIMEQREFEKEWEL